MKPKTKIIINAVIWSGLAVYLILSASYCSNRNSERVCSGLNIIVKDSVKLGIVTPESVRGILVSEHLVITGAKLDTLNLLAVEKILEAQPFLKNIRTYTSMDNKLNIEVEQRTPVARIQSENNYCFYLTEDAHVFPLESSSFVDVPIVTGVPEFPFGTDFAGKVAMPDNQEKKSLENYRFLQNLINFVRFLKQDPFWDAQVVQINVIAGNEVELIPRVGGGIVFLGPLEGYPGKMEKLYKFYQKGLPYEGWNKYAYINLKYKDQVVCTQ